MSIAKPDCPCWLVGKEKGYWIYRCTKGGETRQFRFPLGNINSAPEVYVCHVLYDTEWHTGTVVPQPKGGGGGCVPWDTLILMADNSTRAIENVEVGDLVASCAYGKTELISREVVGIHYEYDCELVQLDNSDGASIETSHDQSVVTEAGPVRAPYVFEGAPLYRVDAVARTINRGLRTMTRRVDLRQQSAVASLDLGGDYAFLASRPNAVDRIDWWMLTCHNQTSTGEILKR